MNDAESFVSFEDFLEKHKGVNTKGPSISDEQMDEELSQIIAAYEERERGVTSENI